MTRLLPFLLALLVADLAGASDSPRSIPQQAEMAFKSDAFEQALGLYRQLTNDPAGSSNSVEVLDRIGDCLFHLDRYDDAVLVYQECLVKFPKGSGRYYVAQKLGDCYAVLGQTNEAFRLYDVGFQAYGYPVFDKTQRVANLQLGQASSLQDTGKVITVICKPIFKQEDVGIELADREGNLWGPDIWTWLVLTNGTTHKVHWSSTMEPKSVTLNTNKTYRFTLRVKKDETSLLQTEEVRVHP